MEAMAPCTNNETASVMMKNTTDEKPCKKSTGTFDDVRSKSVFLKVGGIAPLGTILMGKGAKKNKGGENAHH